MSGSPLPCVLITGFDGFGEDRDSGKNPSSLAALQLQGQIIAGHRVESASLPVQRHTCTTLSQLSAVFAQEKLASPAIIIVGDVLLGLQKLSAANAPAAALGG